MFLAADAAAMLSDFGVPVSYRGTDVRGRLLATWVDEADGNGLVRQVRRRSLWVIAGSLPDVVRDALITIGGKPYRIRDRDATAGEIEDMHDVYEVHAA